MQSHGAVKNEMMKKEKRTENGGLPVPLMNIQPRNDYILIQRIEEDRNHYPLIISPEIAREKSIKGKVLAVGDGKWIEGINGGLVRRPLEVKPGDIVYFNSKWNDFAGDHYTTSSYVEARTNAERDKLHLVQEADIFGIVNA